MSSFVFVFEAAEEDVEAVLRRYADRVQNENWKPLHVLATEIFGKLNLETIEKAVLEGGDDFDKQTESAHIEITRQLIQLGVIRA